MKSGAIESWFHIILLSKGGNSKFKNALHKKRKKQISIAVL